LSFPLKYIQQNLGANTSFNYNIKLNATRIIKLPGGAKGVPIVTVVRLNSREYDDSLDLENPTDFSGEYTLAKK
jgi:hypothetical protein